MDGLRLFFDVRCFLDYSVRMGWKFKGFTWGAFAASNAIWYHFGDRWP